MVEDLKKQMRRFENLINFEGKLDVTSRESMVKLINALDSKFKEDVQNSLRLHRLEFYHDLVEKHVKNREKRKEEDISKLRAKSRKTPKREEEGVDKNPASEQQSRPKPKISDEIVKIDATDIDDWKDLMTLSRIYYVMRHPRSEGLNWKRRISKKKTIEKFEDKDLIEWRVSQDFRLRGLEEWAQRRSDAHRLAERMGFADIIESDEDSETEELFQMFDPAYRKKCKGTKPKKKKSQPDKPFKFTDECIEDWTESYSDDSTRSDVEDITEQEMEDLMKDFDEMDIEETSDDEEKSVSFALEPEQKEEEDISELLAVYPEFSAYKEPIFRQMDEAKTFEDWLKLYKKAISQEILKTKEHEVKYEKKFDTIKEDEEEEYDEEFLVKKEEDDEANLVENQTHEPDTEETKKRTVEKEEGSRHEELSVKEDEEDAESYFEKLRRIVVDDVEDTEERPKQEEEESDDEALFADKEIAYEKLENQTSEPDNEESLVKEEEEEDTGSYFDKLRQILQPEFEDTEERPTDEEEPSDKDFFADKEIVYEKLENQTSEPDNEESLVKEEEADTGSYFNKLRQIFQPEFEDTEERPTDEEESPDKDFFADKENVNEKLENQTSEPNIEDSEARSIEEEGSPDEDRLEKKKMGEKQAEKKIDEPDDEDTKLKVTKEKEDRSDENLLQAKEEAEEKSA